MNPRNRYISINFWNTLYVWYALIEISTFYNTTQGSDSCSPPAEKRAKTSPGLTLSDQKTVGKPKDQESPAAKEGPGEKSDEASLTQEHDDEPKPDENKEGTEASKKNPESEMEKAEESVDEILNLNSKKIREVAGTLLYCFRARSKSCRFLQYALVSPYDLLGTFLKDAHQSAGLTDQEVSWEGTDGQSGTRNQLLRCSAF